MADIEQTVRNLRIQITEDNQKAITAVIMFTVGQGRQENNHTITIPRVIQRRLDGLLRELMKTIGEEDDQIRNLVVDKDYTIRLQG